MKKKELRPEEIRLKTLWKVILKAADVDFQEHACSRKLYEVRVRHLFYAIAAELELASMSELAEFTGRNNHTSALHGVRRKKKAFSLTPNGKYVEPVFVELYNQVKEEFLFEYPAYLEKSNLYERTEIERNFHHQIIAP